MPKELEFSAEGFTIENGVFRRGPEFMRLFGAFQASVVAQARDGINLIVEDVFLDGARDQQRWESALGDVMTLWVGVRCAAAVAAAREVARGDRPLGIAANEADSAHEGVHYDLDVDSATMDLKVVVDHITSAVSNRWALGSTPATTSAPATPPRGALTVEGTVSRAPWEH
jgi:chloramphenicol 3-O phosphotransferase